MKVPNYSGVTDGYVLTKTTTNGSDDVVWSAPSEGGGLPVETFVDCGKDTVTGATELAQIPADWRGNA